jgi:hypothetical protein
MLSSMLLRDSMSNLMGMYQPWLFAMSIYWPSAQNRLTCCSIASSFSISRRRMVVPIYKQWTANTIRIQIVEQDNILQLLAFFEDFSHADAMNFQLRVVDIFEKTDKGGKFGLKLVDAKFALPVEERRGEGKMQKEEGRLTGWAGIKRKFVCLDEIEYPGEHDDILIQFESAESKCKMTWRWN